MQVTYVRKFVAKDGKQFNSAKECKDYESIKFTKPDLDFYEIIHE